MELNADQPFDREEWLSSLTLAGNFKIMTEREELDRKFGYISDEGEDLNPEEENRRKQAILQEAAKVKAEAKKVKTDRLSGVYERRRKRLETQADEIEASLISDGYAEKQTLSTTSDSTPLLDENKGCCSCFG